MCQFVLFLPLGAHREFLMSGNTDENTDENEIDALIEEMIKGGKTRSGVSAKDTNAELADWNYQI